MEQQFTKLARLRANLTAGAERNRLLDEMISIGTYDQLQTLLPKVTSQARRDKILDRMITFGTDHTITNTNKTQISGLADFPKVAYLPNKQYDVFIAHASEDKDFATPLAISLRKDGFEVWYDDFVLKLGDSLQQEIDKGLATSRYGIVILSRNFFNKDWTRKELDGLAAKEKAGRKVILPIWRNITKEEVVFYSPTLAGLKAAPSRMGIAAITKMIIEVISP